MDGCWQMLGVGRVWHRSTCDSGQNSHWSEEYSNAPVVCWMKFICGLCVFCVDEISAILFRECLQSRSDATETNAVHTKELEPCPHRTKDRR